MTNAGESVGEKGTFLHCWWESKWVATMVNRMEVLQKLKIELPYDPAILHLGIYPDKTLIQKNTCIRMFIAALFTIAKTWDG